MKTLTKKITIKSMLIAGMFLFSLSAGNAIAQDYMGKDYSEIEKMQDKNMDYIQQIHEITKDYPAFSYSYKMKDGKIEEVVVEGVKDKWDKKRLEVVLFDLNSNENQLKAQANRIGVFYSVDQTPQYKNGEEALHRQLYDNLEYPEDAKDWGVEGTIYVKFVVDENGNIPFATTSEDVETSIEAYSEDLEKQAISAVKATSGEWEPGEINGTEVASLVVLPITFDFEKSPTLSVLIR